MWFLKKYCEYTQSFLQIDTILLRINAILWPKYVVVFCEEGPLSQWCFDSTEQVSCNSVLLLYNAVTFSHNVPFRWALRELQLPIICKLYRKTFDTLCTEGAYKSSVFCCICFFRKEFSFLTVCEKLEHIWQNFFQLNLDWSYYFLFIKLPNTLIIVHLVTIN